MRKSTEKRAGFDRHMAEARFVQRTLFIVRRKINWAQLLCEGFANIKKMLIARLFYERRLKTRRDYRKEKSSGKFFVSFNSEIYTRL